MNSPALPINSIDIFGEGATEKILKKWWSTICTPPTNTGYLYSKC